MSQAVIALNGTLGNLSSLARALGQRMSDRDFALMHDCPRRAYAAQCSPNEAELPSRRLAVLITGPPRTVAAPDVLPAYSHVFKTAVDHYRTVHVFAYMSEESANSKSSYMSAEGVNSSSSADTALRSWRVPFTLAWHSEGTMLDLLQGLLRGTSWCDLGVCASTGCMERDAVSEQLHNERARSAQGAGERSIGASHSGGKVHVRARCGATHQFAKVAAATELMRRHEVRVGARFDTVLRIRPDLCLDAGFLKVMATAFAHLSRCSPLLLTWVDGIALHARWASEPVSSMWLRDSESCETCRAHPAQCEEEATPLWPLGGDTYRNHLAPLGIGGVEMVDFWCSYYVTHPPETQPHIPGQRLSECEERVRLRRETPHSEIVWAKEPGGRAHLRPSGVKSYCERWDR
jgi:hypothetical protein